MDVPTASPAALSSGNRSLLLQELTDPRVEVFHLDDAPLHQLRTYSYAVYPPWAGSGEGTAAGNAGDRLPQPQSAEDYYKYITIPFHQGLKETDYVEGQNVAAEYRYADNQFDRLPALRVAAIVAGATPATLAAKAATTTIPIVFVTGVDPIASDLVASLNRPSVNLTGFTILGAELGRCRQQHRHRGGCARSAGRPYASSRLFGKRNQRDALR